MIDLEEFAKLQAKVKQLQSEADRAEGAKAQLMQTLKTEHGCSSLESAEKKLAKLEAGAATAEKAYRRALKTFAEEWGEKLQ
jgi:hypothetical protein